MSLINLITTKKQIDTTSWKYFKINRVFNVYSSKNNLDKNKIIKNGDDIYNYVTRTEKNNGIYGKISKQNVEINNGNCLTIGLDTQSVNYQDDKFYTGQNIHILRIPNIHKKNVYIFVCCLLRKNLKTKYFWGSNGATIGRLKTEKIKLPVDANGDPDWEYMDNYIAQKEAKIKENIPKLIEKINSKKQIDTTSWKRFKIKEIFDIVNGKSGTKKEINENKGDIPVIQGGGENNGILGYFSSSLINDKRFCYINRKFLSLARVGSSGTVLFQTIPSFIGDKAKALIPKKEITNNCYLFLTVILNNLKKAHNFNYEKGIKTKKYENIYFKLPVDANGDPDWEYMDNYIAQKEAKIKENL